MKRNTLICLASLALLAGCGTQPSTDNVATKSGTGVETKMASFTNAKGQLICPVLGNVIPSADKAVGHQDYNGKRYYFCCEGCPESFAKNPKKYEDGKGLPKTPGTM